MPKETHVTFDKVGKIKVNDGDRVVVHCHPDMVKKKSDWYHVRQMAAAKVMKANPSHRGGTIDLVTDGKDSDMPSDRELKPESKPKTKDK